MSGINLAKQDEAEVQVRDFDMAGQEGELTPENTKRNTWAEMDLNDTLMSNINRLKWTSPTPVQKYAISILGEHGRDILGCAQTGSGKTGAMLIPVINYLMNQGTNFVNSAFFHPKNDFSWWRPCRKSIFSRKDATYVCHL